MRQSFTQERFFAQKNHHPHQRGGDAHQDAPPKRGSENGIGEDHSKPLVLLAERLAASSKSAWLFPKARARFSFVKISFTGPHPRRRVCNNSTQSKYSSTL